MGFVNGLDLLNVHLYLFGCLLFVPIIIVGFLIVPVSRQAALLAGIGMIPFAPFATFLQDTYWKPIRIGGGDWGIEDIIFGFAAGAVVFWAATWPIASRIRLRFEFPRTLIVLFSYVICLMILYVLFIRLIDPMNSLIILQILCAIVFYFAFPYRELQKNATIAFVGFYFLYYFGIVALSANPYENWMPTHPLGVVVLGLPVGEILWAATFSASYPVIIAHSFALQIYCKD